MTEPKITKLLLDSGEEVHIRPVSPFTFQAVRQAAFAKYPNPNEADYRLPLVGAAIPGDTMPADENPDYVRLVTEAVKARTTYITNAILSLACEFAEPREVLLARYADQRRRLAQWVTLPEDEWEATLLHCIITGMTEPQTINDIANGAIPLTLEEVADGTARFFRVQLPQ